jgi:hypothetical protein
MGLINSLKADTLGKDAARALQQGRTTFVARINVPVINSGMSQSVSGAAEMIEAVEAEGWLYQDMSWTQDAKGRPEGYFLFRRQR